MKRLLQMGIGTTLVAFLFLGCASTGPLFSEAEAKLPPPGANQARLIIYALRGPLLPMAPNILLDGKVVGERASAEVVVVDTQVGEHKLSISTEVERVATFRIDRGEQKYIRISDSPGVMTYRLYPELVDAETARKDLAGLPPYYVFRLQRHVSQ